MLWLRLGPVTFRGVTHVIQDLKWVMIWYDLFFPPPTHEIQCRYSRIARGTTAKRCCVLCWNIFIHTIVQSNVILFFRIQLFDVTHSMFKIKQLVLRHRDLSWFFMFRSECSLKGDLQSAFQSGLQRQVNESSLSKNRLKNKIQKLILFWPGVPGDGTEAQMRLQMSPYGVGESKTGSGSNVHFMWHECID